MMTRMKLREKNKEKSPHEIAGKKQRGARL